MQVGIEHVCDNRPAGNMHVVLNYPTWILSWDIEGEVHPLEQDHCAPLAEFVIKFCPWCGVGLDSITNALFVKP